MHRRGEFDLSDTIVPLLIFGLVAVMVIYAIKEDPEKESKEEIKTEAKLEVEIEEPQSEDSLFVAGDEVYHKLNNWRGVVSEVKNGKYSVRFMVDDEPKLMENITAEELKKSPF